MNTRTAQIRRKTLESSVTVSINLDGSGLSSISTPIGFYNHMLTTFSKHSLFDLTVEATGDHDVDSHHIVEDIAICIGTAIKEALGDRSGITRFGTAFVPLDEALAMAVVDISGRAYLEHSGEPKEQVYHLVAGHFAGSLTRHVFESITSNAGICAHIKLLNGRDPHHIVESQFKAFARALGKAVEINPRIEGQILSTKGVL
ncbi:MAG: imidazoleglycerol-phosphate dehydratase HisB [Candidatus Ancillula sp.]|jgi:imidazoleglycerol-phosphate dehydratase|nr:imidazoleglycerol-phosphate dehydratase HisB [Candidatus Ancillula sp.]